jgi:uncharacterized protein YprB with RNaseH-like and TPR domain
MSSIKHKLARLPAGPSRWPKRSFKATQGTASDASDDLPEGPDGHVEMDPDTGEFLSPHAPPTAPRDAGDAAPLPAEAPAEVAAFASLPGERTLTVAGPLRRVIARFDADHRHGTVRPAKALVASADDMALLALDPTLATCDLSRALYLDTETTGLLGGTGTLPFLVGMAWFESDVLHVEQLFLERPGEEAPILLRLAERLSEASVIVSFNGKSFDWPLLRTRFILQRIAAPKLPPHLDLLHCARRVYKRRLGSVRLSALEQAVLGFERIGDIDGALIPDLYLGFLRGRVRASALVPILDHNRSDLVALPALLGEMAERFAEEGRNDDARDALGFAHVSARAHRLGFASAHDQALSFAAHSAACDLRGELAPEAHFLTGELHRKRGNIDGAVAAYRAAIAAAITADDVKARAHLALAKLYEHKLNDLNLALLHAEQAACGDDDADSEKRRARLEKKLRRGLD